MLKNHSFRGRQIGRWILSVGQVKMSETVPSLDIFRKALKRELHITGGYFDFRTIFNLIYTESPEWGFAM